MQRRPFFQLLVNPKQKLIVISKYPSRFCDGLTTAVFSLSLGAASELALLYAILA